MSIKSDSQVLGFGQTTSVGPAGKYAINGRFTNCYYATISERSMTKNMVQPYQPHNNPTLNRKIQSIEDYGRNYITKHLDEDRGRRSQLMSNPLDALTFFYGKVFMRGRKDTISVTFMNRALEVLHEYKSIHDIDLTGLGEKLLFHRVNNHYDRRMVVESIRFIHDNLNDYEYNIFNWSVDAIRTSRSSEAFHAMTGIHAIGDKLAAFYLRDVTLVNDLELVIQPESYKYFQPIDTWVKRVSDAIGITETTDREITVVKEKIIACCLEARVSPLLFNAGAWMIGANAFQLLIERL